MSDGIWPGKSLPSFTALSAESTAPHLVAENQDEWRAEHGDGVFEAGDRIDVSEIAGYAADKDISTTYVEGVFGSDARISRSAPAGTQAHDERVRIGFAGQRARRRCVNIPQTALDDLQDRLFRVRWRRNMRTDNARDGRL